MKMEFTLSLTVKVQCLSTLSKKTLKVNSQSKLSKYKPYDGTPTKYTITHNTLKVSSQSELSK